MIQNRTKFTKKFKELGSALGRIAPLINHLKAIQAHCEAAGELGMMDRAHQISAHIMDLSAMLKEAQDQERDRT